MRLLRRFKDGKYRAAGRSLQVVQVWPRFLLLSRGTRLVPATVGGEWGELVRAGRASPNCLISGQGSRFPREAAASPPPLARGLLGAVPPAKQELGV